MSEERITKLAVGRVPATGGPVTWIDTSKALAGGPASPHPDWGEAEVVYVRNDNLVLSADATSPGTSLTHLDPATEHAIQPTFAPGGEQIVFTHVPGAFYANIDEIAASTWTGPPSWTSECAARTVVCSPDRAVGLPSFHDRA